MAASKRFNGRLKRRFTQIRDQLAFYRHQPWRLAGGLLSSMCLTMTVALGFWFCVQALHVEQAFIISFLVFTFGFGVGNAAPTPGGIGGVEAALVAGLVAYHVASPTALAAALSFRFISYWLTAAVGVVCLLFVRQRGYI